MENAVYNHLIATGYDVRTGVLQQKKEVDFIAIKDNEYKYIQVATSVADEATAKREFGNLAEIPDNYEKIVVSLNETAPNTYQGIRLMTLREFLLF